jgi:proline racemase
MALLHARGELAVGQRFISQSVIGTRFDGRVLKETRVGDFRAVVPEVTGRAHITGFHQFVLEPDDPFPDGFLLASREAEGVASS